MPMTETYGGVANVWYVSPALFPLIVNGGILILGGGLLFFAIKQGGFAYIKTAVLESAKKKFTGLSEKNQKFAIIMLFLSGLTYVFIPNIDFYLTMALFILVFISAFYFEDMGLLRKIGFSYLGITSVLLVLKITGLMTYLNKLFDYTTDVFVLIFLFIMTGVLVVYCKGDAEKKKKSRRVIITSYLSPFLLIVFFKFLLLIPMPKEGGIIDLMNLVSYSLK
ncbi:MAG: hypothetical protein WCT14_18500 [Treponemataceae bacterium]